MQVSEFKLNSINLNHKSYLFGPFVGELGWELFRWVGFVRWFKINYPDKEIIVCTRNGRQDLYTTIADKIYTFDIQGDYSTLRPDMYRLHGPNAQYELETLRTHCSNLFPDSYIISPPYHTNNRFFYNEHQVLIFNSTQECCYEINSLISKFKNKIPIVISPRHRKDMSGVKVDRNWSTESWDMLFNLIDNDDRFITFIAGDKESTHFSSFNPKKVIILALYSTSKLSLIGLTIEAIKKSFCTIGQQSALPILSNYLGTPTIMWGNEKYRHQTVENPRRTTCVFHEEANFKIHPLVIYNSLREMVK